MLKSNSNSLGIRERRITSSIDLSGHGIEYGPLDRPLMRRDVCPTIRYVDYADRETLVTKYAQDPGVKVDEIVNVDVVTQGRLIDEFLEPDSIDFVVASHVAEHVPDLIGWLIANTRVLKPGGVIACAFPDRRFTFDIGRPPSRLPELLAAHFDKRQQPSLTQIASHLLESRDAPTHKIWSGEVTEKNAPFKRTFSEALRGIETISRKGGYNDAHCWIFAAEDFLETFQDLQASFFPNVELVSFCPPLRGTNEFLFSLRKMS